TSFNKKWRNYELKHKNKGNIMRITYESLLNDTGKELARMVRWVTDEDIDLKRLGEVVEKFSFESQSGRKPAEEDKNSFLRKGISGDWKNKFSREAAEIFDHYAGEMLIEEGYEKNREWTKGIK
ncbi:MAG: sulfotransferase domain-containing protein, partial [Candidatus Aminicenantes bacterium]|nr:sulfotransferase domain-containing protein [Candidatus Aminicenantes bacterium]